MKIKLKCLVFPWDCMTSARLDEPWGEHVPSFIFVKRSKWKGWKCSQCACLDFVLLSIYMIACSKLDDYLYVPTAWGVALDVRRDPDVFSRDPRFVTWSVHDLTNGKQNSQFRNFPFSDRVFLAHVCFIYLKTAVGPTMVTKGGSRSCTTSSIGTSPPGKQICFSMLCYSRRFSLEGNFRC